MCEVRSDLGFVTVFSDLTPPPTDLRREKRATARFLAPASTLCNLQESKVNLLFRSLVTLDF